MAAAVHARREHRVDAVREVPINQASNRSLLKVLQDMEARLARGPRPPLLPTGRTAYRELKGRKYSGEAVEFVGLVGGMGGVGGMWDGLSVQCGVGAGCRGARGVCKRSREGKRLIFEEM